MAKQKEIVFNYEKKLQDWQNNNKNLIIKPGDFILTRNDEHGVFWVKVNKIEDKIYYGTVDSHINYKSNISVKRSEIADYIKDM
jgi:hypothetical protein